VRRRPALLSALTAAALVAVALAGCAPQGRGPGNQPAGCTPDLPSGDASSVVKVSGASDAAPKASFPTPIVAKTSEVTVVKAGHGITAQKGSTVVVDITVFDGRTGKSIGSTGYDGSSVVQALAGKGLPSQQGGVQRSSIADALVCAQAGSRIVLTSSNKRINAGLQGSTYGVAVIDVRSVYLPKADGVNQLPKDGMPNVITAVGGQPGVVVQELGKPTTARSEVVKAGGGAVVTKKSTPVILFRAWNWSGDKPTVVTALDTWSTGVASPVSLGAQGGLPPKLSSALVGQKVGSQVLVVLPPKDGFGAAGSNYGLTDKDTLIFVVDIVGVQK